jgi:hypothetical protein
MKASRSVDARRLVLLLCICASCVLPLNGDTCDLKKLTVNPWKAGDFAQYVARGKSIELTWVNPSPSKPTDQFYEPPLLITDLNTGTRCEVDGGIWLRNEFYTDSDERVIVSKTYSGSAAYLEFYQAADCKRLAILDVSGPAPVIEKNRITYNGVCEYEDKSKTTGWCSPAAVYGLDSSCKATLSDEESRALTKKIFGADFKSLSKIEFPHTPKARILETRIKQK